MPPAQLAEYHSSCLPHFGTSSFRSSMAGLSSQSIHLGGSPWSSRTATSVTCLFWAIDIEFCWASCCVVGDSEGAVLVAFAAGLLNNIGTVSGYTLTTTIRAMARIVNRVPCRDCIYTTQCHQIDRLGLRRVISQSPL